MKISMNLQKWKNQLKAILFKMFFLQLHNYKIWKIMQTQVYSQKTTNDKKETEGDKCNEHT